MGFSECDDCAETLLNDLGRLDDELGRIKTQLDNASVSASSQDRLRMLENTITETKVLYGVYVLLHTTLPSGYTGRRKDGRGLQNIANYLNADTVWIDVRQRSHTHTHRAVKGVCVLEHSRILLISDLSQFVPELCVNTCQS